MADEHKLSFTAAEIDDRLRKVGEAVLSTEQTLTPEQQAQARKNIGAVPVNKTFDVAKTVITGKNLLNVNAPVPVPGDLYSGGFLRGYKFEDDGTITQYSSGAITDYIAVIPGKAMALSTNATGTRAAMTTRRIMGYDAKKQLIGLLASSQTGVSPSVIVNAAYVRFQFEKKDADAEGQVEYADKWNERTEYEPYTEFVIDGAYTLKKECLPETLGAAVLYTPQSLTPEQKAHARANIGAADAQYIQNPNLYDGSWRVGRYDNDTGADVVEGSGYCCSVNPIKLDPSKFYNIQVKDGFAKYRGLVIYKYNADGSYVESVYVSYDNRCFVGGINGVDYIQVSVEAYATDFPNEPLHLMVWETDNPDERYKEWLEYGETSAYYAEKLLLTDEQAESVRAPIKIEVDDLRNEVARSQSDVKYLQNPNLYDGKWQIGRYDYDTGKFVANSNHCCSVNAVRLDPAKTYTAQVKAGFMRTVLNVWKYNEDGSYIGSDYAYKKVSISGAGLIQLSVSAYSTDFPGEPLHVMVWESDDPAAEYTEWLEYGEQGSYYRTKQESMTELANNKARFDDSFNYIAYSSVTGSEGSINTAEHFRWAAKQGFTALKGDVRPTSDGKLIMCHDAGFTLNSNGNIVSYNAENSTVIRSMTEAECLALTHANTGNPVCSFETYIRICKTYGKIAFITIRNEYMEEVVPAMFEVLDKYSMRTRCIVNSFTEASLRAVRAVDNGIMLSLVTLFEAVPTLDNMNTVKSLGNCLLSVFVFPSENGFSYLEQGAEALAYARENDIRIYSGQTGNANEVDTLLQYGITGTQMTVVPNFD